MITKEKIEIYQRFGGDIDGWARIGSSLDKQKISDADWASISEMMQNFYLINNGLVSREFFEKIVAEAVKKCDNNDTLEYLKFVAKRDGFKL